MLPDNYSAFDAYEAEQARRDRVRRRVDIEEEMEFIIVPDDYGTHEDCYPNKED